VGLFQRTWDAADDLPWAKDARDDVPGIAEDDRQLLLMLASGCTDETIAREVGISVRHLRRRVARLMADLGAHSRFEAGAEASRRGWL
jgi:DNA-binding NarL/FixJ family response regulator